MGSVHSLDCSFACIFSIVNSTRTFSGLDIAVHNFDISTTCYYQAEMTYQLYGRTASQTSDHALSYDFDNTSFIGRSVLPGATDHLVINQIPTGGVFTVPAGIDSWYLEIRINLATSLTILDYKTITLTTPRMYISTSTKIPLPALPDVNICGNGSTEFIEIPHPVWGDTYWRPLQDVGLPMGWNSLNFGIPPFVPNVSGYSATIEVEYRDYYGSAFRTFQIHIGQKLELVIPNNNLHGILGQPTTIPAITQSPLISQFHVILNGNQTYISNSLVGILPFLSIGTYHLEIYGSADGCETEHSTRLLQIHDIPTIYLNSTNITACASSLTINLAYTAVINDAVQYRITYGLYTWSGTLNSSGVIYIPNIFPAGQQSIVQLVAISPWGEAPPQPVSITITSGC